MCSTLPTAASPSILIIGYGNPSRSDDGVGWYVAQQIAERLGERVQMETYHQLELDLTEELGHYSLVVFADAFVSESPEGWFLQEVQPAYRPTATSHHFTPASLLAIAQALYEEPLPHVFLCTIKAIDLNFGEELSAETRQHADEAINAVCRLILSDSA